MQRSPDTGKCPTFDPAMLFMLVSVIAFASGFAMDLVPEHAPLLLLASGIAWALFVFAAWLYALYRLVRHLLASDRR